MSPGDSEKTANHRDHRENGERHEEIESLTEVAEYCVHRAGQRRQVLAADDKRRHEVNDILEWAHPYALFDEPGTQGIDINVFLELNNANRPLDPHVDHAGQIPAGLEARSQPCFDRQHLGNSWLALEQVEGRRRRPRRPKDWP